jgi:hypothetical protein
MLFGQCPQTVKCDRDYERSRGDVDARHLVGWTKQSLEALRRRDKIGERSIAAL